MPTEIVRPSSGTLASFDPRSARMMAAGLKGAIRQAQAMKDWAASENAIDDLIELQAAFVAWWDATVTPGESPGDNQYRSVPKSGLTLSADDAMAQTGISKQQVTRWRQRLADVEAYRLLLRRSLQTVAMSRDPKRDPAGALAEIEGRYRTIVIDPPWPMQKIDRVVAPNQTGFDYETMDANDLLAFGDTVLADKTAEDCHCFLWTTQKFLPLALELLDEWNFRYVLTMVWHKSGGFQPHGLPQYNCEFVVYARQGSPVFLETSDFFCCFDGPRREHSRKPDNFYDTIKRVTDGPRLDMFARGPHDGFDSWGNQTNLFEFSDAE
jgi:N6-adenosine-specific RNA methylase IME4